MSSTTTIALIGAGGKMGCRIMDHLKDHPDYSLLCVESGESGLQQLTARQLSAVPASAAVERADIMILALPDRLLGGVAQSLVPQLKKGALVVLLDPAAAHAGELPERTDVSYFVSHPCHPSVFDHFETEAERGDFFGGTHARQAIVCALMQGPESDYAKGEKLAIDIYSPVTRSHRITVAQMAMLEPAMAETVGIALIRTLRDALEEVVARGVPREAAEDFLYGHIRVPLGIAFERVKFPFSDGAKLIAEYGQEVLLNHDWKQVFEPESVLEQCRAITTGEKPVNIPY
ncbi:MAG: phosphogluconate dehydrogenase C-terminal domain-containing protein [Verrucomicrobiota bacterium]